MTYDHQPQDHTFNNDLGPAGVVQERVALRDLAKVPLELSADLGSTAMLVRDVLALRKGSVVQLNKLAGEMADIFVNGIPMAKGEVMVLGDSLQIRIAEIYGATEKDMAAFD